MSLHRDVFYPSTSGGRPDGGSRPYRNGWDNGQLDAQRMGYVLGTFGLALDLATLLNDSVNLIL